ncbi:MAG: small multi-drug export protein [Methanomicrobiales archaeon]|nr:small multi-drug export protein [Methanomicrobiales archaeon]
MNRYFFILKQLSRAIMIIVGIGISLPLIIGFIFGIPSGKILALIASTLALQATASPVGVGLGLPPEIILAVMVCFALGMVMGIYEILDTMALTSIRVKGWLDKTEQKMWKLKKFNKYGAFACILISWIPGLGLYSTPVIAWVLRWNKWLSILCTIFGFSIVTIFFMLLAMGILK